MVFFHLRILQMKIVVTGALGHIGSCLIRELPVAFPGSKILMVDNLLTQRYCSLFNLPSEGSFRFVEENRARRSVSCARSRRE